MVLLLNYFLSQIHTNTKAQYKFVVIWKIEAYEHWQTLSKETMRLVAIYSVIVICKQLFCLAAAAADIKLKSAEERVLEQLANDLAEKLGVSREYLDRRARNARLQKRSVARNDVDMLRTLGLDTIAGEEMVTLTGDYGKQL